MHTVPSKCVLLRFVKVTGAICYDRIKNKKMGFETKTLVGPISRTECAQRIAV